MAGEVEPAWDVRRSHPVPTALSDYDKFRRYTAFRPYPVYRHPEQSLQDSIARLRPRRFRRLSHLHPRISQQSTLRDHPGQGAKTADCPAFANRFSATPLAEHAILLRRRFKHTIAFLQHRSFFRNSHRLATFDRMGKSDRGQVFNSSVLEVPVGGKAIGSGR